MSFAPSLVSPEQLDARARDIFREIVETYLATGEPVGSRTLAKRGIPLSPASIRNTMADLMALGLVDASHGSAGRAPTHLGLRLFIDALMETGPLTADERSDIDGKIAASGDSVDHMLAAASDMLSQLAGGAGLVVTPTRDAPLKHVEILSIGPSQALMVLVHEDGQVENRLFTPPFGVTPAAMQEASNFLTAKLRGRTLSEAKTELADAMAQDRLRLNEIAARLIDVGLAQWSGDAQNGHRSLIVRGRANLLADVELRADLERARQLFDALERQEQLLSILDTARAAQSVRIFIGGENPLFSLSGSSLIVAPYTNGGRRIVGAIGVIGPTRLNYARIIPVIDYTAQAIGGMLDRRRGEL